MLFALAVLGCVLIVLVALTWRKWPDLLVDCGLQLYIPWRISTGAVLYRDLAYMTGGPFSQYFDALLFRLFGVSFLTLALANLALLALLLGLVYRCFYQAADQLTALMACLAILLVFAFGDYSNFEVFTYVAPYSQEIYHGLILSIAAVALLAKWAATQKRSAALAAGFCCGLAFLTKPEVFLAVAAAVLAGLFLAWRITGKWETAVKGLGLMTLAGAVPLLAFLVYFLRFASLQHSLQWTCGAWTPVLTTPAMESLFYRGCMGLDMPVVHLKRMFGDFLGLGAIVVLSALLFRRRGRRGRDAVVFLLVAAPLAYLAWRFDWVECAHSLPLLCLTTLAFLLWRARKAGWNPSAIFMTLWMVLSLVLLAKLGLYFRIWHYGFALAMPAFLTAIYLLLRVVPEFLQRFAVPPNWWRSLAGILLVTGFTQLILVSKGVYQQKTVSVGEGADMLWTFPPDSKRPAGALMGQALCWMQTNTPADSTLAVLPAGVMLNYMLRRPNPTPYLRWNPPEISVFGQASMTRAIEQARPDYIVLTGVDTSEFGVDLYGRCFGETDRFGRELLQWIHRNYQPVCRIGHDWTKDGEFGIEILKRTGAPAAHNH